MDREEVKYEIFNLSLRSSKSREILGDLFEEILKLAINLEFKKLGVDLKWHDNINSSYLVWETSSVKIADFKNNPNESINELFSFLKESLIDQIYDVFEEHQIKKSKCSIEVFPFLKARQLRFGYQGTINIENMPKEEGQYDVE